ncbi:MAG: PASTA domain-containing protein [Ruminococcaceae bacterium]|nr:PASTA domain-containing protein [Oscillospiraceae bacterium]
MENYERYVGAVLDNRYRIEKVIGIGGMAVVFKAEDTLMRRNVAVKILKDEIAKDEQSVKRFINESKAVSMLSHPNIVNIYDVSMKNAEKYIVMEYIEGITLKNYMTKKGVLSLREIIGYTEQILRALEHAHAKGIVHRDIKPQNIMLLKNGIVKVTDFGIAKLPNAETVTMTDKAIGTVYYISPEQASGNAIDARSDIYSLGVLMYEMATGKLPFTADSPVSVALMQINESATSPREINESIPKGLEQIITMAIEKSPEMRYQNATQMIRQLSKLKENPSIQFKNPNKKNKSKNGKQSKSMFPIILGVSVAFLIAAIVSVFFVLSSIFSGADDSTETITIKDFVGQSYTEDMEMFFDSSEYYKLILKETYSDDVPAGKIISQSPEAGETRRVVKGEKRCELTLTVSQGPRHVQMPDVTVLDYREAKIILENIGVKLDIVTESQVNSVYDVGAVISTAPDIGETLENGDTVTLYVSSGPTAEKIEMPDFVGKNEGEALKGLLENKLFPGDVTYEASDKAKGTVLTQSVRAGDEAFIYSFINFTVSGGKDYGKTEETTEAPEETTEDTTKKTDKKTEAPETSETEEISDVVSDTDISDEPIDSEIVSSEPVESETETAGLSEEAVPVDDEL